jgi:hypothetical protein
MSSLPPDSLLFGLQFPLLLAKAWMIAYALVVLGIALGMLVICRPAARQKLQKKWKR